MSSKRWGWGGARAFHDDEGREQVFSPGEADGAPLIYASMGTLVNGMEHVHGTILEAIGRSPDTQDVLWWEEY